MLLGVEELVKGLAEELSVELQGKELDGCLNSNRLFLKIKYKNFNEINFNFYPPKNITLS